MRLLRISLGALLCAAPALLAAQRPASAPADLIVTNARVYTADEARPLAEAFAVREGRIVFVGSRQEANALKGPATRVLDAAGKTVIPGMVDAHAHFGGLAQTLRSVDLVGTRSYDEVIARVVERARTTPKGSWIQGRGWDQNAWGDTRFPTHEKLSAALPDHPVVLERVDGHAVLVNAQAMQRAELTAATKDPSGGKIQRDARGAPTGVLVDKASSLVESRIPAPTTDETRAALKEAISVMHRWGLTGMHDAGASRGLIDLYEAMAQSGSSIFASTS